MGKGTVSDMSDLLRLTGMYSGMDTESVISSLVKAKSTKVTNLKAEQKKLEWKQSVWQDLNKQVYSLYSGTLSKLRLTSGYMQKKTTCSDPTKASIVAGGNSVEGTQTLEIKQLAKSGYLTSGKLGQKETTDADGNTVKEDWKATDKVTDIANGLEGKKLTITLGSGTDAKETEIEITADMKISDLVSKIKEAGVNVSFDESNQRFFISSKSMGESNNFTIGGDADVIDALKMDSASGATKIDGQDSEIILNGATFTASSNTFNVNGLTINATGVTDSEITISTTMDTDGIYDTIKDFLSEYNDIIIKMDKLYNADSARKYQMLTDEEKDSMSDTEVENWENKIKDALLRKDTTLNSVMTGLQTAMASGYTTDSSNGKKLYLSDFGIGTLGYFNAADNEHYAYHIDGDLDDENTMANTDKLKVAIANDPEGTAQFFANLCKGVYEKLNATMGTSTDYSSIYKMYDDKRLKSEYDDYTKRIKEAEEKLSAYEDKWYDKFSAMEVAMAKMQNNSNAVTNMLGN